MLITRTYNEDKEEILQLWQENFAFDDEGYTKFHFQNDYSNVDNYVLKENGKLISTLQVIHHQMVVNDKINDFDFIVGVITKKEQRNKGYMGKLLRAVLAELKAPLILIQAYSPKIYRAFGFEDVYYHKELVVEPQQFDSKAYSYKNEADPDSLLELYEKFTGDKNGYCCRSLVYYQRKQELWQAMNSSTLVVNKNGKAAAYSVYSENKDEIKIDELVYHDTEAAQAAVAYFFAANKRITVKLMEHEHCLHSWEEEALRIPATMVLFNNDSVINLPQLQMKNLYFNEYE